MPGPKTQALMEKLVVPQHKGEEEVWQTSRWVSASGSRHEISSQGSSTEIRSLFHLVEGLGEPGHMSDSGSLRESTYPGGRVVPRSYLSVSPLVSLSFRTQVDDD